MADLKLDEELLGRLTVDDVCSEIFVIDEAGGLKNCSSESENVYGGPNLMECHDDVSESYFTHSSVSIANEDIIADHELIANILRGKSTDDEQNLLLTTRHQLGHSNRESEKT